MYVTFAQERQGTSARTVAPLLPLRRSPLSGAQERAQSPLRARRTRTDAGSSLFSRSEHDFTRLYDLPQPHLTILRWAALVRVPSQPYRKSRSYSHTLIALLPPEFAVPKRHGRLFRSLSANTRVYFHGFPSGWLFLFAVLMAAGLLFCMVFFVRRNPRPAIPGLALTPPLDHHVLRPGV